MVLLVQHLLRQYGLDLLAAGPSGADYLLKQRLAEAGRFAADLWLSHRRHDA